MARRMLRKRLAGVKGGDFAAEDLRRLLGSGVYGAARAGREMPEKEKESRYGGPPEGLRGGRVSIDGNRR